MKLECDDLKGIELNKTYTIKINEISFNPDFKYDHKFSYVYDYSDTVYITDDEDIEYDAYDLVQKYPKLKELFTEYPLLDGYKTFVCTYETIVNSEILMKYLNLSNFEEVDDYLQNNLEEFCDLEACIEQLIDEPIKVEFVGHDPSGFIYGYNFYDLTKYILDLDIIE